MSGNKVDKSQVSSAEIQVLYEHLYKFLMDFLWEFPVVQSLANLEIAVFKRFPDKDEMEKCLRALKHEISATYNELAENDEEGFKDAFEQLESAIESYDEPGFEIYSVAEYLTEADVVEASEEDDVLGGAEKKKFKIGDIKKTTKEERDLQEEAARTLENPFENAED